MSINRFKRTILLIVLMAFVISTAFSASVAARIYRKSMISRQFWFDTPDNSEAREERLELSTWFRAVAYCLMVEWCTCVCHYSGETFILTSLFVTGAVNDTRTGTLIPCQTVRGSSIFPHTGMTSASTAVPSWGPTLVKENLFDGVHGYSFGECFAYGEFSSPSGYFTVDLKMVYPVTNVSVMVQPVTLMLTDRYLDMVVHVGNDSDYSNNPVLDTYAGPPSFASEMLSFTSSVPRYGQFVSVVELASASHGTVLCAMEIN